MRYPALQGRRDANEPEIIAALEEVGAKVVQIPTGKGVPDLLVGFDSGNYLLEIKMPERRLNQKQWEWHDTWPGQVDVVRSPCEALEAIGVCTDLDCKCRSAGL